MTPIKYISLKTTWFLLMLLVVIMSFFALNFKTHTHFWWIILGLSGLKFLLVAFQFMEMKLANGFWKVIIVGYIIFFLLLLFLVY